MRPERSRRGGRRGTAGRLLLPLAVPLFAVSNLLAQTEARMPDSTTHFPAVTGRSLTGRTYHLPGDFEGARNLVLVAFKRHQQEDVDTWTPHLRPLAAGDSGLRVYELPTLGRGYRLMRGMIDGGMRRGIPDSAVRAATITLYINKTPFRDTLGITDESRIHVLLVDRSGRILWRAEGRYTADAEAELEKVLGP
ncbi:MAG: hypothetical protein ABSG61_04265 [Gemmatimonadales bacterium]